MIGLGRILIGLGLLLIVAGGVVIVFGKMGVPLGRLPGDFSYKGKNVSFYFPLATSLLLSALLSLLLWLISRWRR